MKNRRINSKSLFAIAFLASCLASGSQAAEIFTDTSIIDRAMDVVDAKHSDAAEAQEQINRLANSASSLFEEFKRENDTLEALLVLNAGWRKQISNQETQIRQINQSIDEVEVISREIPLLMEKMLTSLEQFIALDYPFQVEQRLNRIRFARDAIDNPGVSIAEKFRQVLVMYQTEAAYGRNYSSYPATIDIAGTPRDVTILQVGRVALIYQTTDRQVTGAWDNRARAWVELDPLAYRTAVQDAIRVIAGLSAPEIIELPVLAPESVQ